VTEFRLLAGRRLTVKKIAIIALFVSIAAPTAAFAGDGELDVTFGRGGRVTTDFDYALSAFQSGQKIVVAGRNQNRLELVRYNPDGSLDTAFGNEGKVTPDFSGQRLWTQPSAVAVQTDEKIVVLSTFSPSSGVFHYTLARYHSDGSRDTTFGLEGSVTTRDRYASSLGIQSDGGIVVSSWNSGVGGRQLLERYNSDGSPDANFGSGGKVETEIGVWSLTIQSDGKIIVAGTILTSVNHWDIALSRYAADGSLDTAFGSGGKVITAFPNSGALGARAVATRSDGKIVMAGGGLYAEAGLTLARYNSDGSLDATFGVEGKTIDGNDASSLAIQSDGEVVVGGYRLARYDGGGILDGTFGSGASVGSPIVWALALQSDGKIITVEPFSLVRYSNRTPLMTFDRPIVSPSDSFTATFSGTKMTDDTYFDVRFRYPGSDRDEVVLNWQHGLSAEHVVPTNTMAGTWGITGIRPHLNSADHSSEFVFVSTELRVTATGGAPGRIPQ